MGASGVTASGISWGAIGGVGLALGRGAGLQPEREEGLGDGGVQGQQRQSVRDLSVVARLMEALHKPATEVTGEAGKDLIVVLDSGSGRHGWGGAGAGAGATGGRSAESSQGPGIAADGAARWQREGAEGAGHVGPGDLLGEIGEAWCEYEQELMGRGVEGVGLSPAAFVRRLRD